MSRGVEAGHEQVEGGRGIEEEGTERQEDKRAREQELDIIFFLIHPKRGREKEEKKRQSQVYRAKIWALQ